MTSVTLDKNVDAAISAICAKHGVRELSLFGSRARGDDTPESDYDFLVEFDFNKDIGYIEFFGMRRELSEVLGTKVDLVSKRGLKPRVRDVVLRDAKIVYEA